MTAVRKLVARGLRRALRSVDPPPTIEQQLGVALASVMPLASYGTVVDVGANEGQAAARFLRLLPNAVVYSLEPESRPFAVLSAEASAQPRLRCFQLALGEQPAQLELKANRSSVTNSFLAPESDPAAGDYVAGMMTQSHVETVAVSTLPQFCESHGIAKIDLLKLDTQGYEERILRGCSDWLSPNRVRSVLTEALFSDLYVSQARFDCVYRMMLDRGYKLHSFHEVEASPIQGWLWADALFIGRP